ncbi:MAG: carbohydrate kinase family protein [archaeon]
MEKSDITFVGALNYDVYVPHKNNHAETSSLSDEIELEIGGGAAITAIAMATLGISPVVVGSVGKHSAIITQEFDNVGISYHLKYHPELKAAMTVADHYADGKKRYRANTIANRLFTSENLREIYPHIKTSRMVMRTGYPWMPQIAGKPTAELFNYARQHNVMTALDMSNPDSWEKRLLEELISEVTPQIDLLCANEKELHRLGRKSDEPLLDNSELEKYMVPERALEYAHRLIDRGVKIVNVHYGPLGTMIVTKNCYVHQQPPETKGYINPTGCGNLQNAGVIYSLLKEDDLDSAAKFGNAMAVLRLSGTLFPTLNEVEQNLQ